jgi:hypothetical protein
MSKEAIEITKPIELKELYILGSGIKITPTTMKLLANRKDYLIINWEKKNVTPKDIKRLLKKGNVKIGASTRIDVNAHGLRVNKQHVILLGESYVPTKDFFAYLRELAGVPLYVHLWSCYGGASNKDVVSLGGHKETNPEGLGSILVTHVEGKEPSSVSLSNHSMNSSLTRYLDQQNAELTPYQQFIFDLPENYAATTFSQVKNAVNKDITKFKSNRIPKAHTMTDILYGTNKKESLQEFFNKFLIEQVVRFKNSFTKEFKVTGINQADATIQLTDQAAKDYATY